MFIKAESSGLAGPDSRCFAGKSVCETSKKVSDLALCSRIGALESLDRV
jgi:hypothetical protein